MKYIPISSTHLQASHRTHVLGGVSIVVGIGFAAGLVAGVDCQLQYGDVLQGTDVSGYLGDAGLVQQRQQHCLLVVQSVVHTRQKVRVKKLTVSVRSMKLRVKVLRAYE